MVRYPYTAIVMAKDEHIRIHGLIENLKHSANILVLLESEDKTTKSVLVDLSIDYKTRPPEFNKLSEAEKTKWHTASYRNSELPAFR